jgi:hypothetical protein
MGRRRRSRRELIFSEKFEFKICQKETVIMAWPR